MANRILTLLIFRAVLISLGVGYQMLSLVFPLPRLPFTGVLWVMAALTFMNLGYAWYLLSDPKREVPGNFVFLQLTIDIVAISVLVVITGGIQSNMMFAYLIFILISALFLEKISIYALTMLSLALYFLALNVSQFLFQDSGSDTIWYWSDKIGRATAAQFVFSFLTALLSGFMQTTYRSGRQALELKEKHIKSLREIRRKIVETLPSGLIICNDSGQINFINRVGRRLLDFKENEGTVSFNAWSILDIRPDTKRPLSSQFRTERVLNIHGTRKTIGISYTPMEQESGSHGYMIIFQDLTKIKMLEASKSLNDRMTAIGKVAAGVAHEIRNPLAAISGSVQVLSELTPDDEAANELATIVDKETKRLNNIISQFMAYAKPGAPPAFRPFHLDTCLSSFFRLAQNDVRLKTLQLSLNIEAEDIIILGDEGKLTQVLWNLTTNSYYASEPGTKVVLGCKTRDEDVVFYVEDEGKGMTEEQVKEVFTPFQSFSKSGTGLGMSIVYDIISMHHGKIEVKSRLGEGTRVEVSFAKYKE